jgi:hypothetical protein
MAALLMLAAVPATAGAQPRGWHRGREVRVIQVRPAPPRGVGRGRALAGPVPRAYGEPATARGYADGYQAGRRDARDGDRYDPVGNRSYRNGDPGYSRDYGSRDAYKNNYRNGFRQGYDAGYRDGRR